MISIHAPRTGSDDVEYRAFLAALYFNPRSPHGERPPAKFPASTCTEDFNPRSPHGERPVAVWTIEPQDEHFNPRSSHGERPRCLLHGHRARAISIHAPRTGSDVPAAVILADIRLFQSTLPARGATYQRPSSLRTSGYFNPRSPHGERRAPATSGRPREPFQSTLPARGATGCSPGQMPGLIFQSTLPARGATRQRRRNDGGKQGFQSTLPARGATRGQQSAGLLVHYFNPRSPHGERPLQCFRLGQGRHFNPRSPHGERRFSRFLPRFAVIISIHAPRTGSDHPALRRASESLPISIHAPRTGSDDGSRRHFEKRGNFNPRSPHGERRADVKLTLKQCSFQSTLPARGATDRVELKDRAFLFQSTLPARGATLELLKTAVYQSFQSTLPARGATRGREANTKAMLISIHAPRTGSDLTPRNWNAHQKNFNPRSPHGERRLFVGFAAEDSFISIHAPRTGSDCGGSGFLARVELISIHAPRTGSDAVGREPRKTETISIHAPRTGSDVFADAHGRITAHFNPRSPHGERHGVLGYSPIAFEFQSTLPARGATGGIQHFVPAIAISIHAPRTGSDPSRQWSLARPDISIHAPRTGSDGRAGAYGADAADFNPRSPHGERRRAQEAVPVAAISIHAPRTGSDDFCRTRTEK